MRWLRDLKSASLQVRVVLVVTSQGISWYRYEDSRITDRLRHSFDEEPSTIVSSCLWLKNYIDCDEASIELIVDTELDDLDRVKLIDGTHQISRSWNIRKVLNQLRREYPDATVSRLPENLYPEVGSVLYSQLTEQTFVWLEKLSECGVVVSHVVTTTQLQIDVFRDYPGPVLLHMFDGQSRHRLLLAADGLPLHLRQAVDAGGSDIAFAESYLCEALKYLTESVFSSLKEVLLVLPREIKNHPLTEFPDEYLAKQYLGLSFDFMCQKISLPYESEQVESSLIRLDSLIKGSLEDFRNEKKAALFNSILRTPRSGIKCSQYAVIRSSAKFLNVFCASRETLLKRRHSLVLRRGTFLIVFVFIFLMLVTSRVGLQSYQEQERSRDTNSSLKANILELEDKANSLHESPFYVMDTVSRIHDFKEVAMSTPQQILSSLAAVVREYPSVSLSGLSWSVVEEESDPMFLTVNSIAIRDHYWGEDSSQYKTMVELSGQIVSESGLRTKQSKLDNFISLLSKSKNIDGVQVIESPVKSAGGSHSMSQSAGIFKLNFSIHPI